MQPRLLHAPLIILLWQTAPVAVQRTPEGRLRLALGAEAGTMESRTLNCDGSVASARPVSFRSAGAQLEAWPNERMRLSAFGGILGSGREPFGGLMAVFEARPIGLGIGVARELGPDLGTLPSLHLRLGSLDRLHFQFDVAPPTPTLWTTGLARFGLGFNRGHRRGVGALVGAAIGPYSDEAYPLLGFAEISVPAGRRVDLLIRGTAGPGHQTTSRAAALGVRLRLDR